MKMVKTVHGTETPVSNEEYKILKMLSSPDDRLYKEDLDPREYTLANSLVSRGVLDRAKINNRQFYTKF